MTLQEVPTEKLMDVIDIRWTSDSMMFMFYSGADSLYATRSEVESELRRRRDTIDALERRGVN